MSFDFYRLRNGVRVVLVPMAGVESVAAGIFLETGSRYETRQINGISHFLEHMVFKGTKKFPTHADTSYLEGLGAIQNAWTDVDGTAYWCKVPAERWREGLELVKELALYPTIPERDLEIERGVILEEMNRRNDRPDELVSEELQKLMFSGNPLEMTVLGEPEVIRRVGRKDFLAYHDRQYVAGRIAVVLAGKIQGAKAEIESVIKEGFGGLEKKRREEIKVYDGVQREPRVAILEKDLANQAHIELAVRGVSVSDERRFALALLTAYLGRGLSSRLFLEVREKRGLAYAIRADEARWTDTGVWSVYAGLNTDKLEEAVVAIVGELKRAKDELLSEEEVNKAKEKIRGPLLFSAENPVNRMNFYGKQVLDRPGEILSYEEIIDRVMQIDAKSIQKVAQDIFLRETVNLAVVGPVEVVRKKGLLKRLAVL